MRNATEMTDHLYTSCHSAVMMVKIVVHQRKGMRAKPNKTEKLGRNHVRGGLVYWLRTVIYRRKTRHSHSSSAGRNHLLIEEEPCHTEY